MLRKYFKKFADDRAHSRQVKADYKQCLQAVATQDLNALGTAPRSMEFNPEQKQQLLETAIGTDNAAVFERVLDNFFSGDLNTTIVKFTNEFGYWYNGEWSPLSLAIEENKPAVALFLAKNPATDIQRGGYGRKAPLKEAGDKAAMYEVRAVLQMRTAELMHQQAAEMALKGGTTVALKI